jgi:putative oxidoreductase
MLDAGILILRVAVGVVMVAHGIPKIFWKRQVYNKKWRQEYGFPMGSVIVQVIAGLAIAVGILTSWSAFILVLNMLVATYISIAKHQEPFLSTPEGKGWDINLLLIGALVALILFGDGSWSLAGWLS